MKLGNCFIFCTDQKNIMNSENSKTSEPNRFKLDLTDKLNLKDPRKTWLQPI